MTTNRSEEGLTVSVETNASEEDVAFVRQGLRDFNNRFIRDDGFRPFTLFVRSQNGTILGGMLGDIYWGWFYISILWLDESIRGKGWGSQMLKMAEEEAFRLGCRAVHLDTMSFQAQPFYEKYGYQVFGVLDDLPVGHQRIFMWKKLSPDSDRHG